MVWTLCTSGAAIAKAGANANASLIAYGGDYKTILDEWSGQAENEIEAESRRTWVTDKGNLSGSLAAVCSSKIAMRIIAYDTTGYLSREADTLLNVNDDIINTNMKVIKDFKSNELKAP